MKRSAADQKPGRCSVSACKELKGFKKRVVPVVVFFLNESPNDMTTNRLDVGNIKEAEILLLLLLLLLILIDIFNSFCNKAEQKEKHSIRPHQKNDLSAL